LYALSLGQATAAAAWHSRRPPLFASVHDGSSPHEEHEESVLGYADRMTAALPCCRTARRDEGQQWVESRSRRADKVATRTSAVQPFVDFRGVAGRMPGCRV